MAYVETVGAALAAAPSWLWSVAICMGAACAWFGEYRRSRHWEAVAKRARTDALVWEAVAEGRARNAFGKRTLVAPQYHAPIARR